MALACQRNSYLKEFKSKVKSCVASELKIVNNGKKETVKGFEVILEDTILFPEGGGQPDDRGTINDVAVLRITRRGADAVHFVTAEIIPDTEVQLVVDWTRRFDHMQQHTGQHLITAVAEKMYGCATTSWSLGERTSFIELNTSAMSNDDMLKLERAVNEKIRERIPVTPILYEDKEHPDVEKFRCRGLPDDHVGPVRVLQIEGIDACLCCGTHVSNLADIQLIKLLSVEKAKTKNHVNLVFVAGGRVLNYLGECYQVERALTAVLKGPLDQHIDLADKAVKGFKAAKKASQTFLRDIAVLEGQKYKLLSDKEPIFVLHRKDADQEFMNIIVSEIDNENVTCFLTVGDEQGVGMFLLSGKEDIVTSVGPKVAEILDGKGVYNRGRYRGKANKMATRGSAEQLIREYIRNNGQTTETVAS